MLACGIVTLPLLVLCISHRWENRSIEINCGTENPSLFLSANKFGTPCSAHLESEIACVKTYSVYLLPLKLKGFVSRTVLGCEFLTSHVVEVL